MRRGSPTQRFVVLVGDDDTIDREFTTFEEAVAHGENVVNSRVTDLAEIHQVRGSHAHFVATVTPRSTTMEGDIVEPPTERAAAALRSWRAAREVGAATICRTWRATSITPSVPLDDVRQRLRARGRLIDDGGHRFRVREVELEDMRGFTVEFGVSAQVGVDTIEGVASVTRSSGLHWRRRGGRCSPAAWGRSASSHWSRQLSPVPDHYFGPLAGSRCGAASSRGWRTSR